MEKFLHKKDKNQQIEDATEEKEMGENQLNRRVSNEQLSSKTYKELKHFKCNTANNNPHKSEQMTWINHSSDGQEFICKTT